MLNRIGAKSNRMCEKIKTYFPVHRTYIEPMCGALKMFFNKSLVKYNFINDKNADIANFWLMVKFEKERLIQEWTDLPIDENLFRMWQTQVPVDPLLRALRFLFLSNCSYKGFMDTLSFRTNWQPKIKVLKNIDFVSDRLKYCEIMNKDFRQVFKSIAFESKNRQRDKDLTFAYWDPPYLDTRNTYSINLWRELDYQDMLDVAIGSGVKFAISELRNDYVIDEAQSRGLYINFIGDADKKIKPGNQEILITNFRSNQMKFSFYSSMEKVIV